MEIRKDILTTIKNNKVYKDLFASYKKLDSLIKKDPINNFLNIRKQFEKFVDDYEELNKKKLNASETAEIEITIQETDLELEKFRNILIKKISQWKEEFRRQFLSNLEFLLSEKKFELKGILPMLKTWLFSFNIDFEKKSIQIWYGPEQEKVGICRLDSEILAETLEQYYILIANRKLDESDFLKKLLRAYEISLFKKEKVAGDQVPVKNILLEYISLIQSNKYNKNPRKEFYTEYPRYLFSYDLYRLKKRKYQNYELTPVIATRAYTKDHYDFIWIPTNEKGDGNYISHIKFREIKNE